MSDRVPPPPVPAGSEGADEVKLQVSPAPMPPLIEEVEEEEEERETAYDLKESEMVMVLRHMFRIPGFYSRCFEHLKDFPVFEASRPLQFIWTVLEFYFKKVEDPHQMPSKDVITTYSDWGIDMDALTPEDRFQVDSYIEQLLDPTEGLAESFVLDRLHEYLQGQMKLKLQEATIDSMEEPDDEDEAAEKKQQLIRVSQKAESIFTDNPFKAVKEGTDYEKYEENLKKIDNVPSGVWFLDKALNGGGRLGEAIGILGPPSGGKTTSVIMLAQAQVLREEHVAIISTEEKFVELSPRIYASATQRSSALFEGGWDRVPEEVQNECREASKLWKEYCHFYDFTDTPPTSIDMILQPIRDLKAQGKHPKYVMLDWWGSIKDAMILHLIETGAYGNDQSMLRLMSRTWLKKLTAKAKNELDCIMVVFHQLSGEAAGKRTARGMTEAQEDKQFGNYFNYVFTYSAMNADKHFHINCDKARRSGKVQYYSRMEGEFCRFVEEENGDIPSQAGEVPDDLMDKLRAQGL